MNVWDIVLLILLAAFIYKGAKSGFVKIIGGFAGIILGAWAAGQFYDLVGQWLIELFDLQLMTAIVIAFIGIFVGINIIISVLVNIITKVFRFIPLATTANHLIGAALGFLEGMLLIGLVIWVINLFPFQSSFAEQLKESRVANYFEYSTKLVQPLLPKGLREIDFGVFDTLNEFGSAKADYLRQNMPNIFKGLEQIQLEKKDTVNMTDTQIQQEPTP